MPGWGPRMLSEAGSGSYDSGFLECEASMSSIMIDSMAQCANDTTFISTGSTGCCDQGGGVYTAGVCNDCDSTFLCPTTVSGFPWGIPVAMTGNVAISLALAFQKMAHNRVERTKALLASSQAAEGDVTPLAAQAAGSFTKQSIWWAGLALQIGGEVGNFAAYGDDNTPSSVVASLGCVSVIVSWLIGIFVLKEPFRPRDILAVSLVVLGVVFIIVFVPQNPAGGTDNLFPCPIMFLGHYASAGCSLPSYWWDGTTFSDSYATGTQVCEKYGVFAVGSDYWYLTRAEWLIYLSLLLIAMFSSIALARSWHKQQKSFHFTGYLAIANTMGGLTVCSAVTVSSVVFEDVLAGGKWMLLLEPVFWIALIVMVVTAVGQVNYLNMAMARADASTVVPVHYVMFTLASITGPSILYQELTLDSAVLPYNAAVMLPCFIFGVSSTFAGVLLISAGKSPMEGSSDEPEAHAKLEFASIEMPEIVRDRDPPAECVKVAETGTAVGDPAMSSPVSGGRLMPATMGSPEVEQPPATSCHPLHFKV